LFKLRNYIILTVPLVALLLTLNGILCAAQPASASVGVLFDTGHQMDASDISGYRNMISELTSHGLRFTEDFDGNITEEDLNGHHILVIVEPDNALSTSEIEHIHRFVATGNSLLVMSDELEESARAAVNSLLSPYHIQQSNILSGPGIYADISSHSITEGVSRYDQDGAGAKFDIVDSRAFSLVRDEDGDTLVAGWNGGARVVVISDESSFRGNQYDNSDNNTLISNIFNWLSDVETPAADFSAQPRKGESPLNVHFNDTSTGNINQWLWDFGDGTGSNEQNPIHEYDNAGTYTVKLSITGVVGSDRETKQDYINVINTTGMVAEVEAAKFVISEIRIAPIQVLPNESVTISVNVINNGGRIGDYLVVLNIDGKPEDSRSISLPAGISRNIVFTVAKAIPGSYEVSIESHKGQFIVIGSTPNASVTNPVDNAPASGALGTPVIIGIITGSVAAAIAVVIVTRRRHRRRLDYTQDLERKYQRVLSDLDKIKKSFDDKQ
jgi:PKD repeat protein